MSDLQSKTDEELNVVLAELTDFERVDDYGWPAWRDKRTPNSCALFTNREGGFHLPRYCSSLDEVAEVVRERIIAPFSDESNDYMDGAEANYARLERYELFLANQVPDMGKLWAATARECTIALIATLTKQPAEPSK